MEKYELNSGPNKVHYTYEELEGFCLSAKNWFNTVLDKNNALITALERDEPFDANVEYVDISSWAGKSAKKSGKYNIRYGGLYKDLPKGHPSTKYPYPKAPDSDYIINKSISVKNIIESNSYILKLLEKNKDFIRRIKVGTLKPADYLSWVVESGPDCDLMAVSKDLQSECPKCGEKLNPERLPLHQKTIKCSEGALIHKATSKGYERTYEKLIVAAVKRGLIDGDLVPIKYDVYVPNWILTATKIYVEESKKSSDNRYAGLSYEEFITGMREDTVPLK